MKSEDVVVERSVRWTTKKLIARVSRPVPKYRGTEWHCRVEISLVPGKRVFAERVIGIDSWQSLFLGMWLVGRMMGDRFPDAYSDVPGDGTSLPIMINSALPPKEHAKLRKQLSLRKQRFEDNFYRKVQRRLSKRGESRGRLLP